MRKARPIVASAVFALLAGCIDVADLGTLPTEPADAASEAGDAALDADAAAGPDTTLPTPQVEGGPAVD